MVLDIAGGLFKDGGLFKPSPDDGQVDSAAGSRRIPVDQTVDTNALVWKGDWSSGTTYAINDWVENDGAAYKCIAASTNNEPPNGTYWDLISSDTDTDTHELNWKGDWDSGTTYAADDWVENDGAAYKCIAASTNNEPPNATYWDLISSDTVPSSHESYKTYAGLDFQHWPTTDRADIDSISATGLIRALDDSMEFSKTVVLPQGAVVTKCIVYGSETDESWGLIRAKVDGSEAGSVMASAAIDTEDTSISNATIDNDTYCYYLVTSTLDNNDTVAGARITYTTLYV